MSWCQWWWMKPTCWQTPTGTASSAHLLIGHVICMLLLLFCHCCLVEWQPASTGNPPFASLMLLFSKNGLLTSETCSRVVAFNCTVSGSMVLQTLSLPGLLQGPLS